MGGKAVAGTKVRFLLVSIDRDRTNFKRYWNLFLSDKKGEKNVEGQGRWRDPDHSILLTLWFSGQLCGTKTPLS